jgi:magnesium chelatase subunit I
VRPAVGGGGLAGKVEFESAEEGRELEVLHHLLRRATADVFRAHLSGLDLSGLQQRFEQGATVETGELVPAADLLASLGPVPGLAQLLARLGVEQESPALAAAALELRLEGLHLHRRLGKDEVGGRTRYGS